MKLFPTLLCLILLNLPTYSSGQVLDSLISFRIDENGYRSIGAKSYWNADPEKEQITSSYYIYNAETEAFVHINDQEITYLSGTKKYAVFKTIDYQFGKVDSCIYLYNQEQVNTTKQVFSRSLEGDSMHLTKVEEYLELDHTKRKTIQLKRSFEEDGTEESHERRFKYVYNENNELIEKIAYRVVGDNLIPIYKLLQTFEDENIMQVERHRYDKVSNEFIIQSRYDYAYEGNIRIMKKENFNEAKDSKRRLEFQKITYLNEEKDIKKRELYLGSLLPEHLYREDVYYYSIKE